MPRFLAGRYSDFSRFSALAVALAVLAVAAPAAPEYALSGRGRELEAVILANTPMGQVTALDLLMFDDMTNQQLWDVPMEALLEPGSLEAERYSPRIRAGVERLVANHALAGRAGAWRPPSDEIRAMSHGAATAVWIEEKVKPKVRVEPADVDRYYLANATDYLRRRQVQVRYIFRGIDIGDPGAANRAREQLEVIAAQVRAGERSFADAARAESDARSAANGGLLPPFFDGTYFPEFESQAFSLSSPGDMTQVFEGPGGLYVIQLVQKFPLRNIPIEDVREEIAAELRHEHIRHYFTYDYHKLGERIYGRNLSFWWPYSNDETPIAIVGKTRLDRQDFMRFYGNPINEQFQVRWDIVAGGSGRWLEGETVLRDLESNDQSKLLLHSWIRRAEELAAIFLRARRVLANEVPLETFADIDASLATLQRLSSLLPGFKSYHLVSFTIEPVEDPDNTAEDLRRALRLSQFVEDQLRAGTLATEPTPIDLRTWREGALQTTRTLVAAVNQLREAAEATQWTDVRIKVSEVRSLSPLPGSPVANLLAGVEDGGFSRTMLIGPIRTIFYVLRSGVPSLDQLKEEPMEVRVLAFQAESERVRAEEIRKLNDTGAIVYQF